ncbi:MAG: hypothetical protein RMM98_01725 [Acidobacteriota bacterium]|nr:hypothetical protein [Blastocatellia bacterium]MDW8238306.1 hypothetical protein [Acidobacteriota bacterium]
MQPFQRRRQVVALFLCLVCVASVLHAQMVESPQGVELPDGEGKGLILGTCVQCHTLNLIALQRKTPTEWKHTVHDMVARGAQVQAEEIPLIVDYLSRYFGRNARLVTESTGSGTAVNVYHGAPARQELPEGEAKAIILRACIQCHPMDRITHNRKDESGWHSSVKDMIRLGAKLRPEEVPRLVAYLAENFGPHSSNVAVPTNQVGMQQNAVARVSQSLPDGEGKQLVVTACVQCHNLGYVTDQRKTVEGWRHTVHDMVARGAQLTVAECEVMVSYLAQHFASVESKR